MNNNEMAMDFTIEKNDFDRAGEASSQFKGLLRKLGLQPSVIRRAAVAMYEAEINLTIHAEGGHIHIAIDQEKISIQVKDYGPGIENVDLAMEEGYSTASNAVREMGFGAGMGLPNMKKCADVFEISSAVGKGTEIAMTFFI